MTIQQIAVLRAGNSGPVIVRGKSLRTARQLEAMGKGRVTSNPGAGYNGQRIPLDCANGGYYVGPEWEWNQTTKAYQRIGYTSA